ncbi:Multidrug resistance regulator 1 [Yarrowia sp. C11]|nr:Multidrug resistance regulator 1 [Yarrowia sp. E02]KAG5365199.1 Multidrug resistance regulator 1 [Yarrowia sp. C11]
MTDYSNDQDFFLGQLPDGDDGFGGSLGTDTLGYFAQDLADLLPQNGMVPTPGSGPSTGAQTGAQTQTQTQTAPVSQTDTSNPLPTPPTANAQYPHKFDSPAESDKTSPEDNETKQRRRRKPLNCQFCRQRKLKCDRQDPCSTCVKKKRGHMCFYTNKANTIGGRVAKSKDLLENGFSEPSKPVTAENPVMSGGPGLGIPVTVDLYKDRAFSQKMEKSGLNETISKLNMDLVEDTSEVESLRQSLGMMKLGSRGNAIYHGESHWGSLFSEAAEVTDFFDEVRKQDGWSTSCVDPATQRHKKNLSALSAAEQEGSNRLAQILQLLPARPNSDKLVKRYFEACEPLLNIIDEEAFMVDYNQFWETPEDTQILWLGLLLGVLSLALQSSLDYRLDDAALQRLTTAWTEWLKGIDHCLEQAMVCVRASMVNIQALVLWICVQSMGNSEAEYADVSWTTFGSLVRVAQSMGLHRDPAWFRMTSEHQEKRRRVWALITAMDVHYSLVEGLPQAIHKDSTDVRPPLEGSAFTKARGIIHQIFMQNYSIASVRTMPYDQVLLLGAKIRKVYEQHKEAVLTDTTDMTLNIMKGLIFEIDHLKMIIAIHRVFASQGLRSPRYRKSREECVSASLRILQLSVWFFTAGTTEKARCLYRWFFSAYIFPTVIHSHLFVTISLIRNIHSLEYAEREKQKGVLLDSISVMANQAKVHLKLEKQFQVCQMLYKKVLDVEKEPPKTDKVASPTDAPSIGSTSGSSPYSYTTASPYAAANQNTVFLDLDQYPSQVFDLPPDMRMVPDATPSVPNKDYAIPQKFDSEWDDLMHMIDQPGPV